ncbi:MAG: hypothetical protein O2816_10695, partial [Planctomycetota bacterium]|nr:hypothetical protein [Planctomycetota bacterium]
YDLEADPGEQTNLAAARPEVAGPLADLVEAWTAASLGLAASTVNSQDIDPEVLDQLAKLGYAGGDEADAGPSDGGKLPLLARAVLEGAERWTLVSLEPDEEVPEDTPQRKLVAGVLVHDRGRAREENRDKLLEALYRGLVAGVEPPEDAPFRPIYGIRAAHRGHICDVLCDYETRRVRVQLDGRDVADLATAKGAERIVREVFEAARVKFESF